jgi:folate-binding protein YgfZ
MNQGPLFRAQTDSGLEFVESFGWAVPSAFQTPGEDLQKLSDAVGLADLTGWGVLRVRGSNHLDFVHRMSTNSVQSFAPGQGAYTVFTTPIGRIVDLAFMMVRDEDLLLVVGRGADESVAGWLQRHIFFNDDVVLENLTQRKGLLGYRGPQAPVAVRELLGAELTELGSNSHRTVEVEGLEVTLVRSAPLGNDYLFLVDVDRTPALWDMLAEVAGSVGGAPAGEMALETKRIAQGWPLYGRELTEDFIPLEAGLKWAISFDKGCYVGQEVIARMETYQRLAKRLVVLGSSDTHAAVGEQVLDGEATVGSVTSVAPLAEQGLAKALAYIKAGLAEPGRELAVRTDVGQISVEVLSIPGTA